MVKERSSLLQKSWEKIHTLGDDIRVEIELRREGIFKRNREYELKLKPVRPFVFKLRSEVLVTILVGTVIVGGIIRLMNKHKKT